MVTHCVLWCFIETLHKRIETSRFIGTPSTLIVAVKSRGTIFLDRCLDLNDLWRFPVKGLRRTSDKDEDWSVSYK